MKAEKGEGGRESKRRQTQKGEAERERESKVRQTEKGKAERERVTGGRLSR